MKKIRTMFITGILVLIPIGVTLSLMIWIFNMIDSIFREPLERLIGFRLFGIGIILTVLIILATGVLATNYLGKECIHMVEKALKKIPLVNTIYISVKQLVDTLLMKKKDTFKHTVLVEYPSKGIYTIGFVTADAPSEIIQKTKEDLISIFIPTTPNPTSGMFIMISKDSIIPLSISIEAALKLIVSGGILLPEKLKNQ